MPDSITPLLADRLDISTDRAQTLLQSMLQELKSRAGSEGVHLSELGTFEEEDGELTFIPSPSLRRRVNHQFEGLSPEDLSGPPSARPNADAPPSLRDSPDEEESPAPSTAEPSPGDSHSPPDPDEKISSPTDSSGADEATEPPEPSDEPVSEEAPPPDGTEAASPEPDASDESIPTLDPIEKTASDETDVPPPDESDSPRDEAENEIHPEDEHDEEKEEEHDETAVPFIPSLIGGLLLTVLLLGIGWFLISQTSLWSSEQSSYETSEAETTQSADPDASAGAEASDDEQPERYAGVRPDDDTEDDPDMEAVDADGSWTVVVASRSSRADAEAMARSFEAQFDSVRVVSGTVNNQTWYRVTVGRYNSEADAERVLDENASMMPSDAWTHELP